MNRRRAWESSVRNGSFQILLFEDDAADVFLVRIAIEEAGRGHPRLRTSH
jgi:hypothetical protein